MADANHHDYWHSFCTWLTIRVSHQTFSSLIYILSSSAKYKNTNWVATIRLYKQRMELHNSDLISVNLFDTNALNDVFEKYTSIIDWKQSIMFMMLMYIPDKTTLYLSFVKVYLGCFFLFCGWFEINSFHTDESKESGFKRGMFFADILGDIFT